MSEHINITGEALYEALWCDDHSQLGYDQLQPDQQRIYNDAAAWVAHWHIAPLQEQVSSLEQQLANVRTDSDTFAELTNQLIQDQTEAIRQLRELARAYREFCTCDAPRLRARYREWDAERDALQQRARKLLGEEPTP